jgi:hypothetical protein
MPASNIQTRERVHEGAVIIPFSAGEAQSPFMTRQARYLTTLEAAALETYMRRIGAMTAGSLAKKGVSPARGERAVHTLEPRDPRQNLDNDLTGDVGA